MNTRDAGLIVEFVSRMVDAAANVGGEPFETIKADFLKTAEGMPGSGACICDLAPDRDRNPPGGFTDKLNSKIDHRCPRHGEKAQPALWGRHKELVLYVTPEQWDALGVKLT